MLKSSCLLITALVVLSGCSSGPSVEGNWKITGMKNTPPGSTFTATFTKPDKIAMTMDMNQDIPGNKPIKLHGDIVGTYTITGDIMEVKADDVKFKADGLPDALKAQSDAAMKDMSDKTKQSINQNSKQKMKWNGNDEFTLSGSSGEGETYTRVK